MPTCVSPCFQPQLAWLPAWRSPQLPFHQMLLLLLLLPCRPLLLLLPCRPLLLLPCPPLLPPAAPPPPQCAPPQAAGRACQRRLWQHLAAGLLHGLEGSARLGPAAPECTASPAVLLLHPPLDHRLQRRAGEHGQLAREAHASGC